MSTPAKAKKAAKPKKAASHPKYIDMICAAITALKDRKGSSRQKIQGYVVANYKVDAATVPQHLKVALRAGVAKGTLKQVKGVGAAGSFKVGEKKAAKPKKAAAKKAKKPKKAAAKKPAGEKKAAKPKKTPAKKVKKAKSPKKAKTPKKAAKPKAKKTPKKAAAKKPKAKKSPKKAAKK